MSQPATAFSPTEPAHGFCLNADQQICLDEADKFCRKELYPLAQRMDDEEWWPQAAFEKIGEQGYCGITVPEAYGGAGLDFFTSGLVCQAMARWNYALSLSWIAHENLCVNNIYRNANEDLRRKYLPALCSGKAVGALGLT
ncbi:MAG: acyl-CoA dehydrogenase family protein, partial [Gammaproteobacteria bacterium]